MLDQFLSNLLKQYIHASSSNAWSLVCSFINPNPETTVCKLRCVIEALQDSFVSTLLSPHKDHHID